MLLPKSIPNLIVEIKTVEISLWYSSTWPASFILDTNFVDIDEKKTITEIAL